ncbi:Uncharacterised protein [Neisseria animaloris]|uniref:Uncharacterized protein n=2 Tax=Neisseria animaloris TaxID=326522 RepID=A0A448UDB6_9NEIS|nr:Uncharacterised protein [Neisseria animaloris]VEJ21899.1 Uncharacterised protein [Neisseria animaloris]
MVIGIAMSFSSDLLYRFTGFDGIPVGDSFSLRRRGIDGALSVLLYYLYIYLKKEPES